MCSSIVIHLMLIKCLTIVRFTIKKLIAGLNIDPVEFAMYHRCSILSTSSGPLKLHLR